MDKTELKAILLNEILPDPSQPRYLIDSIDELLMGVKSGDPRIVTIWESLSALATSILEVGLQQPISVYPTGRGYTIYDGHRRWLAKQLLYRQGQGDGTIECYVRERPEQDEDVLLGQLNANTQREDFNVFELARSLQKVFGHLHKNGGNVRFLRGDGSIETTEVSPDTPEGDVWNAIEKMVGISRSRRYQILAVLENLSVPIQKLAEENGIPESKLRYLIPIKDEQAQQTIITDVLTQNLSNAEIRAQIEALQNEKDKVQASAMPKPIQIESALKPIKKLISQIDGVQNITTAIGAKDPRIVERYRKVIPKLRATMEDIKRVLEKLDF